MEWVQFVIFFLGVFGLFIWNRAEARSDARHMDSKLEAQRGLIEEIRRESINMHKDSSNMIMAIQLEMKDFHAKLYSLEERERRK